MNNLFNEKILRKKADEEVNLDKNNLRERRKYLDKWINNLENGVLDKSKEEEFQGEFLHDIFTVVLNAVNKSDGKTNWNLQRETKTELDGQKADGVLGFFDNETQDIRAVIELKGAKVSLDVRQKRANDTRTPVEQAFGYAPKYGKNCQWVIVSNYREIRLYRSNDMLEYHSFFLEKLKDDLEFKKFIYIMSFNALVGTKIKKAKTTELSEEYQKNQIEIEKKFYNEYKNIRLHIYENMKKNNPTTNENILIEKVQKLLDRFLFICFCEDKELLPSNIYHSTVEKGKALGDIFETFKMLCNWINEGNSKNNISKFNGGLFKNDEILNTLVVDDEVFYEMEKISKYDFDSDLNENILGHIFEQSISDIEELKKKLNGEEFDNKKSKRKKDGIFYTPKYITKYIVENSIKNWLDDKRKELGEDELPELSEKDEDFDIYKKNYSKNYKKHIEFWEKYREAVRNIKILDPACGSGAFLITAFEFLLSYNKYLDDKIADLTGVRELFGDMTKEILENNIFGVDLNRESVEITKLSLWLKTADKNKTLATLENNIKCGNSLIDDVDVAGELAFNWEKEFPQVFENGGFDVVVGNPPYVKEYTAKDAFNGLHNHECYQGKMDLWYLFGWLGLKICKSEEGYIGYIAPNNWITNSGASKFRNHVLNESKLIEFIDFGDYKVFEQAGIQTMIYIMKKSKNNEKYKLRYSNLNNKNIEIEEVKRFIRKETTVNSEHYDVILEKEKFYNNYILFLDNRKENILNKIKANAEIYLEKDEVAQGIVPNPDIINNRNILKIPLEKVKKYNINIGDGVFVVEKNYFKNLTIEEKKYLRPVYEPENFNRYSFNENNLKEIIYINKKLENTEKYYNFTTHLFKFKEIMEERRENLMGSREYYQLHWARDIKFFETGEKIISLRKCVKNPIFSYVENDAFVMLSFNVIKTNKINMKKLLAILNSNLVKFWLQNKGKMQGDIFQIDKEPLLEIPIKIPNDNIINLVDKMLFLNKELQNINSQFQRLIMRKFDLEKLSNKLQDWHLIDFNEFVKELKKLKIKLTLNDEMEWEETFLCQKEKATKILDEINKTDNEIDKMVYELYGMSEEDIRVIEGRAEI